MQRWGKIWLLFPISGHTGFDIKWWMEAGTPSRHLVSLDIYCTPYNWIVFEAVRYDYFKKQYLSIVYALIC